MPFQFLDHTGDVGFTAEAPTLAELLGEAAAAFAATLTDPSRVEPLERRTFAVTAEAPDLLLHCVLEELLYRFEVGGFLPCAASAKVEQIGAEWVAELEATGERRDPARHPIKVLVKAVTYHGLKVECVGDRWQARVIFDI